MSPAWAGGFFTTEPPGSHEAPFCEDMDTMTCNTSQTKPVASVIQKEMKAGRVEVLTPVFL